MQSGVEPLGTIWRRLLRCQHVADLVVKGPRIALAGEIPAFYAPVCPASRQSAEHLARIRLVSVARIAVEKNLEAFLSLGLPGTKVVIGSGPQEAELKQRFPDTKFLGLMQHETLAAYLAAADVFVFPSRTDTFGVVQLEALACGVPIAAFPVTGPKDVVGSHPVGSLNENLRAA